MGIFTDFYVADEAEAVAAFGWIGSGAAGTAPEFNRNDVEASTAAINEWLETQPVRAPNEVEHARMEALERLEYKGVMSTSVSALQQLLLGTEDLVLNDSLFSSMHQSLEKVPDDLVEALARRSEAELLALAPAWAAHEDVRWRGDEAGEFLLELAKLAKTAREAGKGVYLLISGY